MPNPDSRYDREWWVSDQSLQCYWHSSSNNNRSALCFLSDNLTLWESIWSSTHLLVGRGSTFHTIYGPSMPGSLDQIHNCFGWSQEIIVVHGVWLAVPRFIFDLGIYSALIVGTVWSSRIPGGPTSSTKGENNPNNEAQQLWNEMQLTMFHNKGSHCQRDSGS